jgi:hypothetical protein
MKLVLNFARILSLNRGFIQVTAVRNYAPRGRDPGISKRAKHFKEEILENELDPDEFVK